MRSMAWRRSGLSLKADMMMSKRLDWRAGMIPSNVVFMNRQVKPSPNLAAMALHKSTSMPVAVWVPSSKNSTGA